MHHYIVRRIRYSCVMGAFSIHDNIRGNHEGQEKNEVDRNHRVGYLDQVVEFQGDKAEAKQSNSVGKRA